MARNVICDKGKDGRESFIIIADDMEEESSQDAPTEDNNTIDIESKAREIIDEAFYKVLIDRIKSEVKDALSMYAF